MYVKKKKKKMGGGVFDFLNFSHLFSPFYSTCIIHYHFFCYYYYYFIINILSGGLLAPH